MYRLLIVDNEDYVVTGLVELFCQLSQFEFEVIGAYSSKEAMNWLTRTKIDIVISDIRMPGMDGMTLMHEIKYYWPRCKVIFLSGYNDFDYAQRAIRNGAVDYVLKTDGDEALIEAVEKAVESLNEEIKVDQLIARSREELKTALRTLQMDFIRSLIEGDPCPEQMLLQQFQTLNITLNPSASVLMVVGRVDEWEEGIRYVDRSLLMYAVQNIANEYLDTTVQQISVPYDRTRIVWLIQPKQWSAGSLPKIQEEAWRMINRFVHGSFELIQSACKQHLKLKLSIALSDSPVTWDIIANHYANLRSSLAWGLGVSQELIIVNRQVSEGSGSSTVPQDSTEQMKRLFQSMEYSQPYEMRKIMDALLHPTTAHQNYYMVVSIILSLHTQWRMYGEGGLRIDVDKLMQPNIHATWEDAVQYVRDTAERLFEYKNQWAEELRNEIVEKVKAYIEDNLTSDLSLTEIAEHVNLNASYLSRVFKQKSGMGIAEVITETRIQRARELLRAGQIKIQDIAVATGFTSVQYFYRVFKKATNVTPQEYRKQYEQE